MSRTRKILLASLLLIAVVATGLFIHHFKSKSALAQYKAHLRAGGERLTLAELTAFYSTNFPDSMGVITNAVVKLQQASFQPGGSGVMEFVAPGKARAAWMEDEAIIGTKTNRIPWADFSAQLRKVEGELEKIREAMQNPAPHFGPRTSFVTGPHPNSVAIRFAAQWLTAAVINDLRQGHLDNAVENIEALAGLARLHRDEFILVTSMIRVAIAGLGESATWEALLAPGWDETQLERLQVAWESVDLLQALENGFLGERGFGPEIFGIIRDSGYGAFQNVIGANTPTNSIGEIAMEQLFMPAYINTVMDGDELFHLTWLQKAVQATRMLQARRPWTKVRELQEKDMEEFEKLLSSKLWVSTHWISAIGIPNFRRAMETAVRHETQRQMTIAAIALKRYKLRHGNFPESLDELVPEFLSSLPVGIMNGQSLQYRLNLDGSFTLYSVGEDGKDDGGDPTPVKAADKPDLWTGRDAVWPTAVTNEPVKMPAGK